MIEYLWYICLVVSVFSFPMPIGVAIGKISIVHPMYIAWATTTALWVGMAIFIPLGLR